MKRRSRIAILISVAAVGLIGLFALVGAMTSGRGGSAGSTATLDGVTLNAPMTVDGPWQSSSTLNIANGLTLNSTLTLQLSLIHISEPTRPY